MGHGIIRIFLPSTNWGLSLALIFGHNICTAHDSGSITCLKMQYPQSSGNCVGNHYFGVWYTVIRFQTNPTDISNTTEVLVAPALSLEKFKQT